MSKRKNQPKHANIHVRDCLFVDYFAKDEIVGKKNFLALYNLLSGRNLK